MTKNLKLVVNNVYLDQNQKFFFEKKELKIILDLYAKMVSNGEWKDYGLTLGPREISFDFYQRSSDKPIYKILKNFNPKNTNERFLLKDKNGLTLEKSESLSLLINKRNWLKFKTVG